MIAGHAPHFMVYLHFEEATERPRPGFAGMNPFAFCVVDCATSQIRIARLEDTADRNTLRTVLAHIQAKEVVYAVSNLPSDVLVMLRRLPCRPTLSAIYIAPTLLSAKDCLRQYQCKHPERIPPAVEATFTSSESSLMAAAGALGYLQSVLLAERVLPFAHWDNCDAGGMGQQNGTGRLGTASRRMVLDATALGSLEILETLEGTYNGSLLCFLDHTSTPFGHRLLRQWVSAPLCDAEQINQRLDVVEFFLRNPDKAKEIRSGLKSIKLDLERVTARIWGYALQTQRRAVMYEDITAKRLAEFTELLSAYERSVTLIQHSSASGLLPPRLQLITRTKEHQGIFPDLLPILKRLSSSVTSYEDHKGKQKYRPADGHDSAHDAKTKEINIIERQLQAHLRELQAKLPKATLQYVHRLPAYRYEIKCKKTDVPQSFFQRDFEMTGQLGSGEIRFQTAFIKATVAKLDQLENDREDCIYPFLARLFTDFHAYQAPFRDAVHCVAEVDVLLSLAAASQSLSGCSCRPCFVESSVGVLELRECRHPTVASKMGAAFVPNDTVLNTAGTPHMCIVTGPNMGGKSTVLRQTCVAVVMAQLGCYINASVCRLSPMDRIFTRIGSYDQLLEGKSTLLTELEETSAILAHATPRSLAVLDELGRGTSTFDGAAIAAAVLDELEKQVRCLCLFATHYHPVSHEAVRSATAAPFHMAASIDEASQEMTFLYKFLPGLCPASHGHNVAKLAGLPLTVLREAIERSADFDAATSTSFGSRVLCLAEAGDATELRALFKQGMSLRGA